MSIVVSWLEDRPLFIKLSFSITFLILVTIFAVTTISLVQDQGAYRDELRQETISMLDFLERAIEDAMYFQDSEELFEMISKFTKNQRLFLAGRIYDPDGLILADSHDRSMTYIATPDPFALELISSDIPLLEWGSDRLCAGKVVRIGSLVLGAISVERPTQFLEERLTSIRKSGICIAVLAIIFGFFLSLLISRSITKPLNNIILITEKNTDGDLNLILDSNRKDELGKLSTSINNMLGRIQKSRNLLRESERLLAESQKNANIGSWEWNLKSGIAIWSDQLYTICGRDIELGVPSLDAFYEICHPDDRVILQKSIDKAIEEDVPYSNIYRIIREDNGVERWVHSQGRVETDVYGKPNRLLGITQDITEKQKREESMHKSQKLESLGVLAGGIAHDFNNLLCGILGNIEMALMKNTEEKVSTYLTRSLVSIDRSRALTQQLLTFAIGGAPIKKVENLFPFIQETMQFALSGSSVSSRFQIEENLWTCDFDRNQIGQVIDNLSINAQQAMSNTGTIHISASNISLSANEHHVLAAGNYVKLSITDNGKGISKEILPNIFDPYYSTKPNGNGLGLSTSFSIVNRHGGYIEVESEVAKGSTFHIFLPAYLETITSTKEDHPKHGTCEHRGRGTFLVMDDEEIIRLSMANFLEDCGYTVVLKENGKDAIDFFKNEIKENRRLAGMIFDLTIPGGMGGKKAIEEIRKISMDTPAFVISGYSADPVIANPEKYGFNASISKPFMLDELSEMLEKHIKIIE